MTAHIEAARRRSRILRMKQDGMRNAEIAQLEGITRERVRQIVAGEAYRSLKRAADKARRAPAAKGNTRCSACEQFGHNRRTCPKLKEQREAVNVA